MNTIYLDYNATAPTHVRVIEAVSACLAETGNPSSVHSAGRRARSLMEAARESVAKAVGCLPRQVVWTSGGTEANALVLAGTPAAHLFVSSVEHDSVLANAPQAERLAVDANGIVDLEALSSRLAATEGRKLVSVMLANNETGVLQPIAAISERCRAGGAWLHVDAVQALGKVPVDVQALGADFLTLSAHKVGGMKGVGALVLANDLIEIKSAIRGGGQELGRRSGTENLPGIVSFGAALEALAELGDWQGRVRALRDRMEAKLLEMGAVINAQSVERLPTTSSVRMPGVPAETQVMAFDLAGIAVSAGSACSSGKVKASHVLSAMGQGEEAASQSIRVSLGWNTTDAEIDRFLAAWQRLYARRRPASQAAE
ncbi:cysteine desulfurase family protein [Pedomonas mirosovicensis]|uniref:cysteine desulfurase family protein n=1 Tax=Pedomonas mirosovicensis TaxID=2908641 RepID=UPI0021682321|nr:cysteine desulfurase family protein [Pedomonas mirosovicensis]MCH8685207.1 cysteine desulfurase [Pedomonas mirosovicensis]